MREPARRCGDVDSYGASFLGDSLQLRVLPPNAYAERGAQPKTGRAGLRYTPDINALIFGCRVWLCPNVQSTHKNTKTMTLLELADKLSAVLERVRDEGQNPDDIPVTLQLNSGDYDRWGHASMDVCWDNNTQATGCVIVADLEA